MNAITKQEMQLPALLNETELLQVLENSLYPGAAHESIKLVIGYCKAAGLDPMQKPVHIVPIWDSKARMLRDVVMPGIGLYRTQAARGGQYAGVTEPEFGPDVHDSLGGQNITYPSWCRVTVKRLLPNGQIAEFTATERWLENYAQKGGQEKSIAPMPCGHAGPMPSLPSVPRHRPCARRSRSSVPSPRLMKWSGAPLTRTRRWCVAMPSASPTPHQIFLNARTRHSPRTWRR